MEKAKGNKKTVFAFYQRSVGPRNPYWKGRPSTNDLLKITNLYRLLLILKIYVLVYKTRYFNEEVKCTVPSPSVSVPWLDKLKRQAWTNFSKQGETWTEFSTLEAACVHDMHLHCFEVKRPSLKLKTRPKQNFRISPVRYCTPQNMACLIEFIIEIWTRGRTIAWTYHHHLTF